MKLRNSLVLLVFLASLTACADRERLNCPPTKNKALRGVTQTVETTIAPLYGTGGKCV
jgi:predicted small lipoprotein YifL